MTGIVLVVAKAPTVGRSKTRLVPPLTALRAAELHSCLLLDTVDACTLVGREAGVDIVVSIGGGSVIDTSKAVAICLGAGGKAIDHVGAYQMRGEPLPHVVIPTTAGTGSEVTYTSPKSGTQVCKA